VFDFERDGLGFCRSDNNGQPPILVIVPEDDHKAIAGRIEGDAFYLYCDDHVYLNSQSYIFNSL